jgi:hypothetical protein
MQVETTLITAENVEVVEQVEQVGLVALLAPLGRRMAPLALLDLRVPLDLLGLGRRVPVNVDPLDLKGLTDLVESLALVVLGHLLHGASSLLRQMLIWSHII